MSTKARKITPSQRYTALGASIEKYIPHLWGVLTAEDDFIELRLKAREDGSILAIVKRYSPDGGPVVLFGNGYGASGALLAADAAIQGDSWREDKPWPGKNG